MKGISLAFLLHLTCTCINHCRNWNRVHHSNFVSSSSINNILALALVLTFYIRKKIVFQILYFKLFMTFYFNWSSNCNLRTSGLLNSSLPWKLPFSASFFVGGGDGGEVEHLSIQNAGPSCSKHGKIKYPMDKWEGNQFCYPVEGDLSGE